MTTSTIVLGCLLVLALALWATLAWPWPHGNVEEIIPGRWPGTSPRVPLSRDNQALLQRPEAGHQPNKLTRWRAYPRWGHRRRTGGARFQRYRDAPLLRGQGSVGGSVQVRQR